MGSKSKRGSKTAVDVANEATTTASVANKGKSDKRLLRKNSRTSVLDTSSSPEANTATANQSEKKIPKLQRKPSSLQDVNKSKDKSTNHTNEDKRKKSTKAKRQSTGWSAPGDAAKASSLPAINASVSSAAPIAPLSGRSKRAKKAGDIELVRQATIDVVVKYQLGQNELKKFKMCFNQIDLDSSGLIDYDEFFEFIDECKTAFSQGLFRMIDADSNGSIDYEEFVHATVLYCMYTRDEILQFAFNTFDPANTGSIGEKEFKKLISLVNDGKPIYPGNFKNALAEFDRNKDGVLDFEEFKNLNKRYPMLLFPCFRLQDRMQKATLGESHWLQLHKRLYQKLKLEIYQIVH